MATTGAYLFNPDLAEIVEESFQRVGIDPEGVTGAHIRSARRSMNLMLSDWATRGVRQWAIQHGHIETAPGMMSFELPVGALDVLGLNVRRNGTAVGMTQITLADYDAIPNRASQGMPWQYAVDRNVGAPSVYIWPAADNDTDIIEARYVRQLADVGGARNTVDIPDYFYEAFVAGLAAKLAEKYQPERLSEKMALARDRFDHAKMEDGSRASLFIRADYRDCRRLH